MKQPLCLFQQDAIKAHWRLEVELHTFLTSAPDGHVISFTPGERAPPTPIQFGQLCGRVRMLRKEKLPEI